MIRNLLPCPVCGGESFLESVTQGGLICSDCGAVSNQVEVAEEEDPQLIPKSFARMTSYRHVTEEESQAKRERKVVLGMPDRRDTVCQLRGFGLILSHLTEACVNHGYAPPEAKETIHEVWLEFLTAVGEATDNPVIMSKHQSQTLLSAMARWGIPEDPLEIVARELPTHRLKRIRGLHELMEERRIAGKHSGMIEEAPFLIYAHDWLCNFFMTREFPLSDRILYAFISGEVSWKRVRRIRAGRGLPESWSQVSASDRRVFIRKLFVGIVANESIRKHFISDAPMSNPKVPAVDMDTLLAVLIVGLRRAGVGVLPIHLLNWIARGHVGYFSAHKHLPQSVERLEYYRVRRTGHGYRRSIFSVSECPSVATLDKLLSQIQTIGVETRIPDRKSIIQPSLNFLGLDSLASLCHNIHDHIQYAEQRGKGIFSIPDGRKLATCVREPRVVTDSAVIATVIALAMSLTFPDLSGHLPPDIPDEVLTYEVMSHRFSEGMEWDNLSNNEKRELLSFVESELLEEIRECLVDDLRTMLSEGLPDTAPDKDVIVLRSDSQIATPLGDLKSYILQDVGKACQVEADMIKRCLTQLNRFIYR